MGAVLGARTLTAGLAWRWSGIPAAGRRLVRALTGTDPDDRVLAGILLTRAGDRSIAPVSAALAALPAGADPGELATVLASIGTDRARTALADASRSPHPDVAAAAAQALRTLDAQPPPGAP